ncbi:hypothetical protein [Pseudomonas putida]|uniref:Uncharacterized protein n=1 Tax=Pseudomonas putida TaxID=303 RepID=A0A8I1EEC3_PSEPU|nr:hypothetical protein [Pseudomonas putida]MBI6883678.1 hypothetical protein [Pseudomonas putida]
MKRITARARHGRRQQHITLPPSGIHPKESKQCPPQPICRVPRKAERRRLRQPGRSRPAESCRRQREDIAQVFKPILQDKIGSNTVLSLSGLEPKFFFSTTLLKPEARRSIKKKLNAFKP